MKGFTLIETIVALGIFILALVGISGMVIYGYRTYRFSIEHARAVDEAKLGLQTMVREIREARWGQDGSWPIEKAGDKEFIFYSDIDSDGKVERVRYFLGDIRQGHQVKTCVTFINGGSCQATFSNFFAGTLNEAKLKVSLEGDLGWDNQEYADIIIDGGNLGRVCYQNCSDCAGAWEGTTTFNVLQQASDNFLSAIADASNAVNNICHWQEASHSMKAKFELSFLWQGQGPEHELKKGVIKPVGQPPTYPLDQENVTIISHFVRNAPPIFEYFDANLNRITETPARLSDTRLIKIKLVVDLDPEKPPQAVELESSVYLRNLQNQ